MYKKKNRIRYFQKLAVTTLLNRRKYFSAFLSQSVSTYRRTCVRKHISEGYFEGYKVCFVMLFCFCLH